MIEKQIEPEHKDFKKLVYVERESWFMLPGLIKVDEHTTVSRFHRMQRAIGVVEGVINKWNTEVGIGEIEIKGRIFPCACENGEKPIQKIMETQGKLTRFSFWPTLAEAPKKQGRKLTRINYLKIARVYDKEEPQTGYIEVIGILEKIWPNEFLVSIWSKVLKKSLYVPIAGKYPYPDEIGKFIWVVGRFDAKIGGVIRFEEASAVGLVPKAKAFKIFHQIKHQYAQQTNVERIMVNARLKIVLRESPTNLEEMKKMVMIPLQNQPKAVPGKIELPETPVNLVITNKMWNKASKKAKNFLTETGLAPIYVIETLIGIEKGKLIAVANGIQVIQRKSKEKE